MQLGAQQYRPLPSVVILQKDKSQLDEPVYHCLNAMGRISLRVLYLNDYGLERVNADDELQLVPNFSDSFAAIYQKEWLRYDGGQLRDLIRALKDAKPKIVLAADLDLKTRMILSAIGKRHGFLLAVRSDKNEISQAANTGARLWLERRMYQLAFGALLGASELTFDYYKWKNQATRCLFPYSTDQRKFTAKANERENMRRELGLTADNLL